MSSKSLTANACRNAKAAPAGKRNHLWDAQVPGLALRVTEKGAKSWCWIGRIRGRKGAAIRVTLGRYIDPGKGADKKEDEAEEGSLAWAREKAREVARIALRGRDPRGELRRQRQQQEREQRNTFRAVAEHYKTDHLDKLKRGNERWSAIKRWFMPRWSDLPVTAITQADILDVLQSMDGYSTDHSRNRRLADIRALFNWCLEADHRYLESNPALGIKSREEEPRKRSLSDQEIREVWAAFDAEPYPWGDFFKLLFLTAQRRSEVAQIKRSDLEGAQYEIDDTGRGRIKKKLIECPTWLQADNKSGRPHVVPLSPQALAIIESLPEWKGDYLFTTTAGKRPLSGFGKAKSRIDATVNNARAEAGLDPMEPWRLHDLRRTAGTAMSRLGVSKDHRSRVLNHAESGVTDEHYNAHDYLGEKHAALCRWADELDRIVSGGGKVLKFGKAKKRRERPRAASAPRQ